MKHKRRPFLCFLIGGIVSVTHAETSVIEFLGENWFEWLKNIILIRLFAS